MPAIVSARFPRTARLLTQRDFQRVFHKPLRSSDTCFTVLARLNGMDQARLGLAISKKQLRRAVDRNRIKRLIREGFRLARSDLAGIDLVVLARPGLARKRSPEIYKSLARHWQRLIRQCARS